MKALKIMLIVLVIGIVLVVGGLAILVKTFDPNDYKEQLAAKVAAQTGRTLTLDGPIEWGLWPKLRLKAGPLSLSNAPGFGAEPMLAAKEIDVAVATWPLLRKRVEMDTARLTGVVINLAKNADGVTNWGDLAKSEPGAKSHSGSAGALALGGVEITDAQVSYRDDTRGQDLRLSQINFTTGALTLGAPVDFKLALKLLSKQPALDGDIALAGTVAYRLSDQHYTVQPLTLAITLRGPKLPGGTAAINGTTAIDVNLDDGIAKITGLILEGLDTKLRADVQVDHLQDPRPGAHGTIALNGKDLGLILNALEASAAGEIANLKDRSFEFKTDFNANMDTGEVALPAFNARLLGATLEAKLTAQRANTDQPAAHGSLNAQGPDLPALLLVLSQLQGGDPKSSRGLYQVLSQAKDRSFNVQTELDADLATGRIDLPTLNAKLLGNTLMGTVTSTGGAAGQPAFKGQLQATGPDLPALLAAAGGLQGADSALGGIAKSLATTANKGFTVAASFDADLKQGRIELPKLSAQGLGLELGGNFKADNIHKADGAIGGRVTLKGTQLQPLLTAVGQPGLAKSVQSLDVDTGVNGTMSDLTLSPLSVTAQVAPTSGGKPVALTLGAGTARANLTQETLTVQDLSLTGLGMNLKANLDAAKIKSAPEFAGKLNVPVFDLRRVLTNLNLTLPVMADTTTLTKVGLDTSFKGTAKSIALPDLVVKLDETTLTGKLTLDAATVPDVDFALAIDRLNADRYSAPRTKGEARPVTPEAAAVGAAQLPVETLRKLKGKGELSIGSLQVSGAKLQNLNVKFSAAGGKIEVKPLAADLYQGKYQGVILLDATKAQPSLVITTNLSGVAIAPLLVDLSGNKQLSGVASFAIKLNAAGPDTDKLKNSLAGQGNFEVKNGVFQGVDIHGVLQQVELIIESKQPAPIPTGGATSFESLTGTLDIQNGVIRNKDLLMDGSGFKLGGEGILANLNDLSIKYDMSVSADSERTERGEKTYNLGGYTVPIACRGKISQPSCLPDATAIIRTAATNAVKRQVEKQLKDVIPDKFKKLLPF